MTQTIATNNGPSITHSYNAQIRSDRFQTIVEQIRSFDDVLKQQVLDPARATVAHRLLGDIERGLEQLGRATAHSAYVGAGAMPAFFSQIDRMLDHLGVLCEELSLTMGRPAAAEPIPVV